HRPRVDLGGIHHHLPGVRRDGPERRRGNEWRSHPAVDVGQVEGGIPVRGDLPGVLAPPRPLGPVVSGSMGHVRGGRDNRGLVLELHDRLLACGPQATARLMRVGITGGTGVVGAAVLRHLLASGAEVVATARSKTAAEKVKEAGAMPAFGEVTDLAAMAEAFSGCEVVYHVAGVNEMCSPDPAEMYRVNVEGTRTVLRACAAASVPRMVLTSSAATIGEPKGVVADEN